MTGLVRAEWLRMRSRPVAYVLAAVGGALLIAAGLAISRFDQLASGALVGLSVVIAQYAAIVGIVLGASFVGAEWASGQIVTILTWEPRRERALAAKLIAGVAGTLAVVLTLAAFSVPVAVVTVGTDAVGNASWGDVLEAWARLVGVAAVTTSIGMSLATLLRNTAGPLIAWFVFTNPVEFMIGLRWPWLRESLIGSNLMALGVEDDIVRAVSVLGAWTAVILALAFVTFSRRDV